MNIKRHAAQAEAISGSGSEKALSLFVEGTVMKENAKLEALQETVKEVGEIQERQDRIIENQQMLIEYQKEQITVLFKQSQASKNLFASGEDGVAVQKEIMQTLID